jgi:hypothetical protein
MSAVDNANDCCSGNEILVTRVLLFNPAQKQNIDYIRGTKTLTQEITDYKALSRKFGNTRRIQRNQQSSGMQFKANALRQLGSSALSVAVPGDSGPLRFTEQ